MKKTKRIVAFFTASLMAISLITSTAATAATTSTTTETVDKFTMRDMTTTSIVADMGLGWNLGNTFDALNTWTTNPTVKDYETAWGSPVITKAMIDGIHDNGFNTMRLPVAWSNLMTADNTISPALLDRVEEVMNYALDNNMYVILNIHWDGGWIKNLSTDYNGTMKKYKAIWTQLTTRFAKYGDHLVFESLNEEAVFDDLWNHYGSDTTGKAKAYEITNSINQSFVDLVRAAGGNNAKRHLLIAGYATDVTMTCDPLYKMPTDSQKRCAVSVHYYTPYTFALMEKDETWGQVRTTWGTDSDKAELNNYMNMLKTTFIDKGIPVIMGEYGIYPTNKTPEMIKLYLSSVCEAAYKLGICPVLWDTPGCIYDRTTCKFIYPELITQMKTIVNTARPSQPTTPPTDDKSTMRDMTTTSIVADMGLGWNLGNTLEACGTWITGTSVSDYEKAWGSPIITKTMIDGIHANGFNTMRLPVAWSNLMASDYTIKPELLDRVEEVMNYALDNNMYVILNIHWDGGWFSKFSTDYEGSMKKYKSIWTQLTTRFAKYGDHLVFESLNEEAVFDDVWNRYGSDTTGKAKAYGIANSINQSFVDLVRASGGNNAKRHLLIAGYATDVAMTCDPLYKMPTDPQNRCAVSIHYYTPYTFALMEKDESWGQVRTTWGTDSDKAELNNYMNMLKTTFIDKGIPVIMGEYGIYPTNKTPEMVRLYLSSVCEAAFKIGVCPILWDTPGCIYDRNTCTFIYPELITNMKTIVDKYRPAQVIYGDLNNDKVLNIVDYILMKRYILNMSASINSKAADINCDGSINAIDSTLLKQYLLGQIANFFAVN